MKGATDVYTEMASRHGHADSARYRRILQLLMTPVQAQIAALLPATPDELAQKLNLKTDRVKKELEALFVKGVVIPKDFSTLEGARFARSTIQLHDATEADARSDQTVGPELLDAWEDFCQNEWYAQKAQEYARRPAPQERVIPAYRAIADILGVSPYDDVREILKASPLTGVVPCSCRRQVRKKDAIIESCLQFGRSAEYAIARGSGKKLSYDEALAIVDQAEEDGEVHMWRNWRTFTYGLMCNCTNDACVAWTPLLQHDVPISQRVQKSRFQAEVDQGLCDGCQVCIDRCQFDAIDMQKPAGSKKFKALVSAEKCWGCGVCVLKCDPKALRMKLIRPLAHIPGEQPATA